MIERSYVMVKPEFANHKGVILEVANRLTDAGMKIIVCGYVQYTPEAAKQHYAAHVGKDFYPALEKYITSDVAFGMIVEGENAIATIRALVGPTTDPEEGTIRYDVPKMLGIPRRKTENVTHSSDGKEAAKTEAEIFISLLEKENVVTL